MIFFMLSFTEITFEKIPLFIKNIQFKTKYQHVKCGILCNYVHTKNKNIKKTSNKNILIIILLFPFVIS